MGHLSTRVKILRHLGKAVQKLDVVMVSLKIAHDVSQGGHPRLESTLPYLVDGLDEYKKLLLRLRDEI